MTDPLPGNLAFACSLFPSIAHVCRRISVNRQQFNRYLAGQGRPSRHNMHKICDFFGVTESELLLEKERFAELLSLRRAPRAETEMPIYAPVIEDLTRASGNLDRYVGCYYRYFRSFGYPGKIIRSLAVLSRRNDRYLWKNLERRHRGAGQACEVYKYTGMAFLLGDRITILEYESLLTSSITQMTLYPSYGSGLDCLVGVQIGASRRRGRKPAASTVMLQYLGKHISVRRALTQCGFFDPDELDPRIPPLVTNQMPPDSWVFEVEQL